MSSDLLKLPQAGKYRMIAADPPWHFRARTALQMSNWTSRRDAEKHYSVLGVDDIAALPVKDIVADDAHLLLWITGPLFVEGKHLPIMKAWGFRPSSVAFTWVKLKRSLDSRQLRLTPTQESDLHVGLGLTTRKNAEFCILGRRGNAKRLSKSVREIILSPVREHSRKPDEFYDRARQYAAGPYLELFSRQRGDELHFTKMVARGIRPFPMIYGDRHRTLPLGGFNGRVAHKPLWEFQKWAVRRYYELMPFEEFDNNGKRPDVRQERLL